MDIDWSKTAVVIMDMWNKHIYKSAVGRISQMAPVLNDFVRTAREQKALIIHSPSACYNEYFNNQYKYSANGVKAAAAIKLTKDLYNQLRSEHPNLPGRPNQKLGNVPIEATSIMGSPGDAHQVDDIDIEPGDAMCAQDTTTDSATETYYQLLALLYYKQ
jgi:hypothetical protein